MTMLVVAKRAGYDGKNAMFGWASRAIRVRCVQTSMTAATKRNEGTGGSDGTRTRSTCFP